MLVQNESEAWSFAFRDMSPVEVSCLGDDEENDDLENDDLWSLEDASDWTESTDRVDRDGGRGCRSPSQRRTRSLPDFLRVPGDDRTQCQMREVLPKTTVDEGSRKESSGPRIRDLRALEFRCCPCDFVYREFVVSLAAGEFAFGRGFLTYLKCWSRTAELASAEARQVAMAAQGTGRRSFHGVVVRGKIKTPPPAYPAFTALIHLFAAAGAPVPVNAGRLPDEIYQRIMDHSD
ncbi:MAG: hypothetical protein M1826_002296 [Phylliscum demangeonii]|nr:MAG: hypothetical protein M1826_002296 [Phylliscum demangeonii]